MKGVMDFDKNQFLTDIFEALVEQGIRNPAMHQYGRPLVEVIVKHEIEQVAKSLQRLADAHIDNLLAMAEEKWANPKELVRTRWKLAEDPSVKRIAARFQAEHTAAKSKPFHTLSAKVHRTETLVKGYDQKVKLNVLTNTAFDSLSEEKQEEITEDIKNLKITDFSVHSDTGHIELKDRGVGEYVYLQVDDSEDWKYDKGEVNILKTKYDRGLEPV
jgi:DNA primase catalytic subunit